MAEKSNNFSKFLVIWLGEFISSIGSGLTAFALGVYVFQTTGSAAAVSLTTLFAFLTTIMLNPVGGVLADRYDRRLMMICGDLFSAFGLVYMLICFQTGGLGTLQIYIGVTISAVFVALLEPAYKATITDLLTPEEFSKASSLMQLAASSKYLLSPVLGGLLLSITDVGTILIIDISTIITTVIIVAFIRKSLPAETKQKEKLQLLLKDMKEGWDVVTGDRGVLAIVVLISVSTFYLGLLQTLISPMILSFSNSKALGMVETISATGMLLGSFIIGIRPLKRYASTMATGFTLAGVFMAFLGTTINLILITAAGFLFFCTLPYINTSADVMVRCRIPNELQGRAWGLISILSQIGYILAYACAGILADNIFNPMLIEGGLLSGSTGRLIGVGPGRGIGFMLVISGVLVALLGFFMRSVKIIQGMEPAVNTRYSEHKQMPQKQSAKTGA